MPATGLIGPSPCAGCPAYGVLPPVLRALSIYEPPARLDGCRAVGGALVKTWSAAAARLPATLHMLRSELVRRSREILNGVTMVRRAVAALVLVAGSSVAAGGTSQSDRGSATDPGSV